MKEDDYDVAARRPSQYYHDRYGGKKTQTCDNGVSPAHRRRNTKEEVGGRGDGGIKQT